MRKSGITFFIANLLFVLFSGATGLYAGGWPGQLPGVEIGGGLSAGYEPSGAVWHPRLNRLFLVSDNFSLTAMDYDGSNITNWFVFGDLEGVCIADPTTDFVYVGVEWPDDSIIEFDFVTGQIKRVFDLTPWMQSSDPTMGLESVTFVTDSANPEGGLFYAGLQENSDIYMFELPIKSSATSTEVTYIGIMNPADQRPNLSGLHYERNSGVLYAIWSYGQEKIRAMEVDGTTIVEWTLAGDSQEGIALWEGDGPGERQIFIAEDMGEVWRYDFNALLDVTIEGEGTVEPQPDPPGYYGTHEILTAVSDSGYPFVGWGGDLNGTANPETLLMDYDKTVTASFGPLGIGEGNDHRLPRTFVLSQNCPNPFNPSTRIEYNLEKEARISLKIYDIRGQLIRTLVDRVEPAGRRSITWDGRSDRGEPLSSGIYIYGIEAGNVIQSRKMVLLK